MSFLISIVLLIACVNKRKINEYEKIDRDKFKILKISKYTSLYLVEASRNDSIFSILYPFQEKIFFGLKKGNFGKFHLKRLYPPKNFSSLLEVDEYKIGKAVIKLSERNHWSVYTDTTQMEN